MYTEPTHNQQPLRVFLCHASGDKEEVRNLYRRLKQDGLDPWLDEENLLPGQDWRREIPQAVAESEAVIVALSDNSIKADGYVREEIRFALDAADKLPDDTIYIIPLKLEECEVPKQLARWQWVDLYRSNGYEKLIRSLQFRAKETGAKPPIWKSGAYNYVTRPKPQKSSSWFPKLTIGTILTILVAALAAGNDFIDLWDRFMLARGTVGIVRSDTSTPHVTHTLASGATYVSPVDGATYRYVPAGEFIMGSSDEQVEYARELCRTYWHQPEDCEGSWVEREQPQHTIYLDSYWIMETEVTNAQYGKFMEAGGYTTEVYWSREGWTWRSDNDITEPRYWRWHSDLRYWRWNSDLRPVVGISWYEAEAYANWLSAGTRLGLGLPTEAQWEKAARGTDGRHFPWGNQWDANGHNYCDKNCTGNWADEENDDDYQYTAPVGIYPAGTSSYGALDMAGNVWEWTADWYAADYYKKSPDSNPVGPESGEIRVVRGGSWSNSPDNLRTANRGGYYSDYRNGGVGFRLRLSSSPD